MLTWLVLGRAKAGSWELNLDLQNGWQVKALLPDWSYQSPLPPMVCISRKLGSEAELLLKGCQETPAHLPFYLRDFLLWHTG